MKLEFKDSFFESVERLVWYDTKLWKAWEFITRTIPRFFKNIWRFRKELASHEWWDYRYTLEMLYRSLSIMVVKLEKDGIEEDSSRMKKVNAIKRALKLIKHKLDDDYVDRGELKLGEINWKPFEFEPIGDGTYSLADNDTPAEKRHMRKYSNMHENWKMKSGKNSGYLKGNQNMNEYKKLLKDATPEELMEHRMWNNWFNGSDMRGWWD